MSSPFQSPTDLRSLAAALRQRGRNGALTRDDVERYCNWILENAAEWERQQRNEACLPLLRLLGFAVPRRQFNHPDGTAERSPAALRTD